MKKNITGSIILAAASTLILIISINQCSNAYDESAGNQTATYLHSSFSPEADKAFYNTIAKGIDLNSGITIERALPVYDEQANNISFAVFNHTNETIIFSNQGFDLVVFRFDEAAKIWERLKLPHTPYPETTLLLPKVDSWSSEDIKTWTLLEEDTVSFEYKQLRLYVSGRGEMTNISYGAYLDVTVSTSP